MRDMRGNSLHSPCAGLFTSSRTCTSALEDARAQVDNDIVSAFIAAKSDAAVAAAVLTSPASAPVSAVETPASAAAQPPPKRRK
jgi:ribosomal protein L12E/L44/L45/RPP1/RPP2